LTDTSGAEPAPDTPAWGTKRPTWTERDSLEAEQAASLAPITENRPVEADGGAGLRALDAALGVEAAIAAAG
jgi:hypothetical protein